MKKLSKIILLLLILSLSLSNIGCIYSNFDFSSVDTPSVHVNTSKEITNKASEGVKDIPKADKDLLFKMCKGFVHLINSDLAPATQVKMLDQLRKVQRLYGWPENKYPEWNKCFREILENKDFNGGFDYTLPQDISKCKDNLTFIFESICEAL